MKNPFSFFLLILILFLPLVPLAFVDYEWTGYLQMHAWPEFSQFVKQSLFESEKVGASDLGVFLWFIFFLTYLGLVFGKGEGTLYSMAQRQRWRVEVSYVLWVGAFFGVGLVHPIKLAWGRARPSVVDAGIAPYSAWYEFGPLHPFIKLYSGSFPSGHVATIIAFFCMGYLLWRLRVGKWRVFGCGLMGLSAVGALLMGIGRSMAGDHWLSDSWASLGLGVVVSVWAYEKLEVEARVLGKPMAYDGLLLMLPLLRRVLVIVCVVLGIRWL